MSGIGFTGTRLGMTKAQLHKFTEIMLVGTDEFHHGDAIGADTEAAAIVEVAALATEIHVHPATIRGTDIVDVDPRFVGSVTTMHYDPRPPLVRNRDIVDATDMLIAAPATRKEVLRSGTWATIRYAKKMKKWIYIIYPSGHKEIIRGKIKKERTK